MPRISRKAGTSGPHCSSCRRDYGPSLEDIAHTLRLEPRHFGALSGLGIILDRLGDSAGALEAFRRAYRLHPNLEGALEGIEKLTREVEGETALTQTLQQLECFT